MTRLSQAVVRHLRDLVALGRDGPVRLHAETFGAFDAGEALVDAPADGSPEALVVAFDRALRAAVEAAFAERSRAVERWPAVTDCDRLRRAFDALEAQQIITGESCGDALDEGIDRLAIEAAVRDELGRPPVRGFCFFHAQDLSNALDGEAGLALAFGSFVEAGPTGTERVGELVARALTDAGLLVRWSGSAGQRISLPEFRWQRRRASSTEADVRAFIESWELELRAGYLDFAQLNETFLERVLAHLGAFSDCDFDLLRVLGGHTKRALERELTREGRWHEVTVNDRITAAFESLQTAGIFASESCGLTVHDGWAYAALQAPAGHHGAAFFHHEDVIDALQGRDLWVAFGELDSGAGDATEAELRSEAVGRAVVAALAEHGVPAGWSGGARDRIRIAPFEWKKRRWTSAPPVGRALRTDVLEATKTPVVPSPAELAPSLGTVVRALRDESGFDLARAKRARAEWDSLGTGTAGQLGHLGLPHAFIPAGGHTSMVPRAAAANLAFEERRAITARAHALRQRIA